MNLHIFELAGKIAGIGGMSICLVLLIFRQILAKIAFPKLEQENGYKLLKLIIYGTLIIAVLGIAAWLISDYINRKRDSQVQLVDLTKTGGQAYSSPAPQTSDKDSSKIVSALIKETKFEIKSKNDTTVVLEFKLRNIGDQVAYIKRVKFYVKSIVALHEGTHHANVPISANYDIVLPLKKTPYTIYKDLDQSIKPGEVDRFTFTISTDDKSLYNALGNIYAYIFLSDISLIYDEDGKSLGIKNVAFSLYKNVKTAASGYVSVDDKNAGVFESNMFNGIALQELKKFKNLHYQGETKDNVTLAEKMLQYKRIDIINGDSVIVDFNAAKPGYGYFGMGDGFISDLTYSAIWVRDTIYFTTAYSRQGQPDKTIDSFYVYHIRSKDMRGGVPAKITINSLWSKDGHYMGLAVNKFLFYVMNNRTFATYRRNIGPIRSLTLSNPENAKWADSIDAKFDGKVIGVL